MARSVRDLVNHLVGEDLWAPLLLAGSTIDEVGDRFEGDVLGSEPKAAWTAASAAAVRAVGAEGAMDRIVHLSFGDFPVMRDLVQSCGGGLPQCRCDRRAAAGAWPRGRPTLLLARFGRRA